MIQNQQGRAKDRLYHDAMAKGSRMENLKQEVYREEAEKIKADRSKKSKNM